MVLRRTVLHGKNPRFAILTKRGPGRIIKTAQEAGGWSPITGGAFSPGKGEMLMVTYAELFQLALVVIGVATLFYHIGRHIGKRK